MMSRYKLFDAPIIGERIKNAVTRVEGGEKESETLREFIANKYKVTVEKYTYGSCFDSEFNTGGRVIIGRYCSFGPKVHYFGANHPIDHAVMSAYFYNKDFGGLNVQDVERHTLTIGNDVWIGYGVTIVSTCHNIGNGAVIAANSVVTKDVPPYAIVGGVPAKLIRFRFDEDTRKLLEKSKWWDRTPEELYRYYDIIDRPKEWAEKVTTK